jgi:hypothetical protein
MRKKNSEPSSGTWRESYDAQTLLSSRILEGGYLDHCSQFARDYGDDPDFAFARRPLVDEVNARKAESGRDMVRTPCLLHLRGTARPNAAMEYAEIP